MNKALLLLLVTLVQSQSDGIRLPGPTDLETCDENLSDLQFRGGGNSDFSHPEDVKDFLEKSQLYGKRSANDVLTRRSALDKNFMRFGRDSGESESRNLFLERPLGRAGRGSVRFGGMSPDGLIRFDRGGKDSFIRFGRSEPEDFSRFGKSMRDNFIRFGKADKNFMRFGRDEIDQAKSSGSSSSGSIDEGKRNDEDFFQSFPRVGKSSKVSGNFLRFGKSGNQKEGRNGTNFLRFGKKGSTEELRRLSPEENWSFYLDLKDSAGDKDPRRRFKRGAEQKLHGPQGGHLFEKKKLEDEEPHKFKAAMSKRSPAFFEKAPENYSKFSPFFASNSLEYFKNYKNSLPIPQFPASLPGLSKSVLEPNFYWMGPGLETKRNQGGSNFIRFG